MMESSVPQKVTIVYFTGTGSTRLVARHFEQGFREKGIRTYSYEINSYNYYISTDTDLLLILYPVYAFNAPKPIYTLISKLPNSNPCPVAVISVSAGGDITPNRACRLHCINRLEHKGYPVIYEQMIVMPSNFIMPTPKELSARLIEILPDKVNTIINDLLSGKNRRTNPDLLNRIASQIGELEKSRIGDKFFGRHIVVDKNCTSCGLCRKNCPTGNIKITVNTPVFGHQCSLCLRCIYSCPKNALKPAFGKFIILKQGYRLKEIENTTSIKGPEEVEKAAKGYGLSGIRKYLLEKDSY